jgi:hypothetical protein
MGLEILQKFSPGMLMAMVLSALVALLGSLFMVYWYIARIRTDEFHREVLLDAVAMGRYVRLVEESGYASAPWPATSASPSELDADHQKRADELAEWNKSRNEYLKTAKEKADREAAKLVPYSLSVAGMGITGSFFIELTAILTVIFGVVILGLVGVLGTREIGPILASIAGYVLGKTTSGLTTSANSSVPAVAPPPPPSPPPPPPPATGEAGTPPATGAAPATGAPQTTGTP